MGAQISSWYEYMEYTGDIEYLGGGTLTNSAALIGGRIRGVRNANQNGFRNLAQFKEAIWTTASVSWPEIGSNDFADRPNQAFDTPDIKSIIQEIVNLSGWQSGNSITLWAELQVPPTVEYDPYPWPFTTMTWVHPSVGSRQTYRSGYKAIVTIQSCTYSIVI
jgi:hypothetical protein